MEVFPLLGVQPSSVSAAYRDILYCAPSLAEEEDFGPLDVVVHGCQEVASWRMTSLMPNLGLN